MDIYRCPTLREGLEKEWDRIRPVPWGKSAKEYISAKFSGLGVWDTGPLFLIVLLRWGHLLGGAINDISDEAKFAVACGQFGIPTKS